MSMGKLILKKTYHVLWLPLLESLKFINRILYILIMKKKFFAAKAKNAIKNATTQKMKKYVASM